MEVIGVIVWRRRSAPGPEELLGAFGVAPDLDTGCLDLREDLVGRDGVNAAGGYEVDCSARVMIASLGVLAARRRRDPHTGKELLQQRDRTAEGVLITSSAGCARLTLGILLSLLNFVAQPPEPSQLGLVLGVRDVDPAALP